MLLGCEITFAVVHSGQKHQHDFTLTGVCSRCVIMCTVFGTAARYGSFQLLDRATLLFHIIKVQVQLKLLQLQHVGAFQRA